MGADSKGVATCRQTVEALLATPSTAWQPMATIWQRITSIFPGYLASNLSRMCSGIGQAVIWWVCESNRLQTVVTRPIAKIVLTRRMICRYVMLVFPSRSIDRSTLSWSSKKAGLLKSHEQ